MTSPNSVSKSKNGLPPIFYIFLTVILIFIAPKLWIKVQDFMLDLKRDRASIGNVMMIEENATESKKEGVKAFKNKDYPQAIEYWEKSLNQYPNDPETLIYLNNAKAGDQVFKIAVVVPIGSNLNIAQEILRGVAQAQTEINQQGGINGKKLQIEIVNDENDPEIAKQVAETLIQDSQVIAVVGHNSSNASLAAAPIYEKGNLVMITPTSMANNLSGSGNYIFRTVFPSQVMAEALANYVINQAGKKKIAFCIDSQVPDTLSFKDEFVAAFVSQGGQLAATVCDISAPNFDANLAVDRAISAGADSLFISSHIDRIDQAINLARANRGRLPLFSNPTLYTMKTLQSGQQDVKGLVLVAPWYPKTQTGMAFAERMQQRWLGRVNWRTAMAYDATLSIIEGLKQGVSRQELQKILRNSYFSLQGASGTIQFTPTGDRLGKPMIIQVQSRGNGYDFEIIKTQ